MKKTSLTPVTVLGTVIVLGAASVPASADVSPFGMTDLTSGYQVAMGDKPESNGTGDKKAEGKCGEEKKAEEKKTEGKCGVKQPDEVKPDEK